MFTDINNNELVT